MIEKIKLIFTYSIAAIVILGGLVMLYLTRLDPPEADVQGMRLLLAGFIGSALTFVFGRESSASSAFQTERAYNAGLAAPTITPVATTTTTTSEGPPATSTTVVTVPAPAPVVAPEDIPPTEPPVAVDPDAEIDAELRV